ncbi:hypothetical protein DPMN_166250 [Dreissena polymorpha]|uniref:Uncharacterized protein n=1 Tax=Dreissena polymorpha TaxID=45954 RepID=A0A9D4IX80_DREPO|nr:hypothetical protein DPMN_166250 [Dreissena polymorpha]
MFNVCGIFYCEKGGGGVPGPYPSCRGFIKRSKHCTDRVASNAALDVLPVVRNRDPTNQNARQVHSADACNLRYDIRH